MPSAELKHSSSMTRIGCVERYCYYCTDVGHSGHSQIDVHDIRAYFLKDKLTYFNAETGCIVFQKSEN